MNFLIVFIIFLFIVILYLFMIQPRHKGPDSSPFLLYHYAHRGLHDNKKGIPENSLTAFQKAVANGYGMELDVQLTKDGVPVVFHDFDLNRMCGINKKIIHMDWSELQTVHLLNTTEGIPSFESVLQEVNGATPLIVELKIENLDKKLPETVNRLLSNYNGLYCIESFNPGVLYWYRKNNPSIIRGQLSTNFQHENNQLNFFYFCLSKLLFNFIGRPDFIAYNWKYRHDLSRRLCKNFFHALSAAWTIKSQTEMDLCRNDFSLFIFEGFIPNDSN